MHSLKLPVRSICTVTVLIVWDLPEPEIVEIARPAALPAALFACGPHQHVVEHETYAVCLDCQRHVGVHTGRKCLNYHALRGRPCVPFKREKRAKL
eukprot:3361462-Amphidinium_carterae.1